MSQLIREAMLIHDFHRIIGGTQHYPIIGPLNQDKLGHGKVSQLAVSKISLQGTFLVLKIRPESILKGFE